MLPKRTVKTPVNLSTSKNIFLYFDYEREFSGHKTSINDTDINQLINLLNEFSVKCTWFSVGQIFEKYPGTIKLILENGHELGSHTYKHVPPLHTKSKELWNDFLKVEEKAPLKILGFHAPNGRWSLNTIKYLKRFGYKYDVVSVPKTRSFHPFIQSIPFCGEILRLHTVGDDWDLYQKNKSESDVLNHFKMLYSKVNTGHIAGLGFHPWVLFSDLRILQGFLMFMKFLNEQPDLVIKRAIDHVTLLEDKGSFERREF